MKKSEVAQILSVLAAAYPRFPEINEVMVSIWFEMFQDVEYKIASMAVKKLILENTFPPAIAELRKAIVDITTPPEFKIDAAEAWGEVTSTIRNFGYYREDEALASMSPRTAKVVKMIGFREICISENVDVIRGQFRMMYETMAKRERQDALVPEGLRNQIEMITQNSRLLTKGRDETACGKEV